MRIAIGCDHAGFELKQLLHEQLVGLGDEVQDFGTESTESCDYPDIAIPLAQAVAAGGFDFGVLICSTGVGPSIVANKVHGIRAALCNDVFAAKRSREHQDANILCIGAWSIGRGTAAETLCAFRDGSFEGGRHERRLAKLAAFDDEMHRPATDGSPAERA